MIEQKIKFEKFINAPIIGNLIIVNWSNPKIKIINDDILNINEKSLSNEKATVDKLRKEIEKLNSVNGDTGKQVNELQSQ